MGDHEDEIPKMPLHIMRLGMKILLSYMILHWKYLHILVIIPHSQVAGIGYQGTILVMNPQALVMFVMACLMLVLEIVLRL